MVLNAGCESTDWISSDFALQAYINGSWQNVDNVSGNTDNYVSRGVTAFRASRIRLHVIKGQQDDNHTTRIYEFAVYRLFMDGIQLITKLKSNMKGA